MPRHAHPDVHRPVNDNKLHDKHADVMSHKPAVHHASAGHHSMKKMDVPNAGKFDHSPQATSLPGSLPIIHNLHGRREGIHGVPGIISSTTTSPETRQRLVSGIIDSAVAGHAPSGPVSTVHGVDSTAYNSGMIHIRGSPFTTHHHSK
jgi:hypothetical protein